MQELHHRASAAAHQDVAERRIERRPYEHLYTVAHHWLYEHVRHIRATGQRVIRAEHGFFVGDPGQHRVRLGFVEQGRARALEYHGVAHLFRRRERAGRVHHDPCGSGVNAAGFHQRADGERLEPAVVIGGRAANDGACGIGVEVAPRGHVSCRLRPPLRVVDRVGKRPCGPFRERVARHRRDDVGNARRPIEGGEDRLRLGGRGCRVRNRAGHFVCAREDRRNEDREQAVDPGIGQQERNRATVLVGGRRRDHVHGITDARRRRQEGPQRRDRLQRECSELETVSLTGVGSQDPGAAGVGEDRHPRTRRQRLVRHKRRGLEHLLDRARADHPCIAEQRVHHLVARRQRAGMRRRRAGAGVRAPGLHRDDRLVPPDAAGDLGEAARVAEALHVHQDHRRAWVVLPVFDQVVGRDVGLVAHGDEAGQTEIQLLRKIEHRETKRAALAREGDRSGGWIDGGEGAVQSDGRVGVQHAHAVRPDEARAGGAQLIAQSFLLLPSFFAGFAEPRADHHNRRHPSRDAVVNRRFDGGRWNGNDREIDVRRNVEQARIGAYPLHNVGGRIDREYAALESAGQQVVEDVGANRAARAAGADHRDRLGPKQCVQ